MTELMEQALSRIREFSPELQDEFAAVLLRLAEKRGGAEYRLSPEELADLAPSLAAAKRGNFASADEVTSVYAKYGL